jgi:3-(3-hydroxy-phenyl)propionate hydroxylase
MQDMSCDIAIIGLGPTGAVLANLLGRSGYSVVGLEREPDVYYSPRAVHFDDETMRVFQAANLSEQIGGTSEPFTEMEFLLKTGGRPAMRMKVGSQDFRYGHHGSWWFHQPTLERHLHDGLKRFPNVIPVYGAEVTGISQNAEGATVRYRTRDGACAELRARYVIGADGGRSLVRREAALPLDTADFDEAWVVVDTKTLSGAKHPDLPKNHRQICDPKQPVTYVPLAGPYYEWQFMVMGQKTEREATDPAFVRRQLRRFVDLKTIEITRIAYYRFHALWAQSWRNGRIILAGDAAHQMPPFLGQGMCSGIRDAVSLSWRLDLVLRGVAGQSILDDYQRERSAHVQHIIQGAMFLGHVIQTRNPLIATLRNWLMFRPGNFLPPLNRLIHTTANRKRPLREGFLGNVNRKLAGQIALQPQVALPDGRKVLLDEALGSGFALLARRGAVDSRRADLARLTSLVDLKLVQFAEVADAQCIGDAEGKLRAWFDRAGVDFVLIRPDRYVFDAGRANTIGRVVAVFLAKFPATGASIMHWRTAA